MSRESSKEMKHQKCLGIFTDEFDEIIRLHAISSPSWNIHYQLALVAYPGVEVGFALWHVRRSWTCILFIYIISRWNFDATGTHVPYLLIAVSDEPYPDPDELTTKGGWANGQSRGKLNRFRNCLLQLSSSLRQPERARLASTFASNAD